MKGYTFPAYPNKLSPPNNNTPRPSFRADTSRHKQDLINTLRRSEQQWNDDRTEESLINLRKAINTIQFIIQNESIDLIKEEYEAKMKELKARLKNREEGKEAPQNAITNNNGGNGKK